MIQGKTIKEKLKKNFRKRNSNYQFSIFLLCLVKYKLKTQKLFILFLYNFILSDKINFKSFVDYFISKNKLFRFS